LSANKEKLLVSACLLGKNVKYNGKNNCIDLEKIKKYYEIVPFCPEVEGGLETPRPPSEIISFDPVRVINNSGQDVTKNFLKGARKALELCKKVGIKKALLKERSPSCGKYQVYDGSFSKRLVNSSGITATLLKEKGIKIYDENELDILC